MQNIGTYTTSSGTSSGTASGGYRHLTAGRSPSAFSDLETVGGRGNAEIEFFNTPLGILVSASISDLEHSDGSVQGTCSIEISGEERRARARTFPPIFLRDGRGHMSFVTGRFSLCDIIGRKITLSCGEKQLACGLIRGACAFS